jgi:hypothetical protein
VCIVNLDPANEHLPYECDVSITQLITIKEAMKTRGIGPNNAMIVAMEYLNDNIQWLEEKIKPHIGKHQPLSQGNCHSSVVKPINTNS